MEFFSEIYGCYYEIVAQILARADIDAVSKQEILDITDRLGFSESGLTIPDKLFSEQWSFLNKTETGGYVSRLDYAPHIPLTLLQKRWLKTLLSDERIRLFLDDAAFAELSAVLKDIVPLWNGEQFYYYDRYENGDDFSSEEYRRSFRLIVEAAHSKKTVRFDYTSSKGKHGRAHCLPLKIEYSPKNDRFRLIALRCPFDKRSVIVRYRLDGIKNVRISDAYQNDTAVGKTARISRETFIPESYDAEPVRLHIHNRRNALERAMLLFANYDKDTRQLNEDTWECCIYYDSSMETELLIEILSFGSVVKVVGPDSFVNLIRERLKKQILLTSAKVI